MHVYLLTNYYLWRALLYQPVDTSVQNIKFSAHDYNVRSIIIKRKHTENLQILPLG